jgi:hypothetical protein
MVMQTMRAHFIVLFFATAAAIGQTMPSPATAQTDSSASEWRVGTPPTSKAISLGTFRSTFAVFDALDAAGVHVGEMAAEALHRPAFTVSDAKTSVQLVTLSAAELGINEPVALATLYSDARQQGFEMCPAEVAVQMRLQYRDQPIGESLNIAMEPIATYEGEPVGLTVANGGAGLMIVGQPRLLKDLVDPRALFIFVLPQQMAQSMLK